MSNGEPPPTSGSSYIIICSGRIAVEAAHSAMDKAVAASTCAARFAAFMSGNYGESMEDAIKPLAAIQHHLMNLVKAPHLDQSEAEATIKALFDEMSRLETQY